MEKPVIKWQTANRQQKNVYAKKKSIEELYDEHMKQTLYDEHMEQTFKISGSSD